VTTLSRTKRWRMPLLKLVFAFGRTTDIAIRRLIEMRTIAFARWTLLPSPRRPRYLMFETNWSGAEATYIPDFGLLMRPQWQWIWGNTKGFPGSFPTTRLLAFVAQVDWGCDHFWSDYDSGSTTEVVLSALQLQPRVQQFIEQTRGLPPDEFAVRWKRFTTDVQQLL